jgi:MHS family proline/betaine transporter-like MFS transporter
MKVTPKQRLTGAAVGAFVEWYDFHVYALTVPTIAALFFPKSDPAAALLSTFAVYALALLSRPIGGPFFGYLGDKYGRMRILSLTVLLMGAATLATGLLPTYPVAGIAAPLLLVICRLAQGCCAAGETSGALSYALESAPANHRAKWASLIGGWGFLPVALAAAIIFGLRGTLGNTAYADWGWRIPFICGGLLGVFGLFLRLRLDDPDQTVEARIEASHSNPILTASVSTRNATINAICLTALQAVTAYTLLGYMYTFLIHIAGLTPTMALVSNATANVMIFVLLPIGGALADRLGRKPLLFIGSGWLLVCAYPAFILASQGSLLTALFGQLLLIIGFCIYAGANFATTLELFPTSVRQSGHALAYNLSFALFGGFTPLLSTYVILITKSPLSPACLLIAAAILGGVAVCFTPETKNIDLRTATL